MAVETVWKLRSRGIDLTPEDGWTSRKRGCFSDAKSGQGLVVVNVMNADTIPSYRKDEIINVKVAFIPDWMNLYESEEELEEDARRNPEHGIPVNRRLGEVSAVGLRYARSKQAEDGVDKNYWDDVTDIKAVITEVSYGTIQDGEVTKREYFCCTVDTEFGPLEILQKIDKVDEAEKEKIKEGSIVFASGVILADPLIDGNENENESVDQFSEEPPLYYEYDPDGIPMVLPLACIGLNRYFAFGSEIHRYMIEKTQTGRFTWSYDHLKAYDVRHEEDICFVTEYDIDPAEKTYDFHSVVPLGNNDRSIWDARIVMQPKAPGSDYRKNFVILQRKDDRKGIAVLKLVQAGLYPSYMEDEEIRIRVTAFPGRMEYFGTEEELFESLRDEDGEPIDTIADGLVVPTVFFRTHDIENKEEEDFSDDNVHLVRGVVTDILPGRIPTLYGNETHFLRCYIRTEFGEMEILHTEDMIPEDQRKNMKPGSIVYGVFRLYGNPAFAEYEYGVIGNEENNLRKLREVLVTGAAEEMYEILDEDAEITFDGDEEPASKGRSGVIDYLKLFYALTESYSSADLAIIDKVKVDGHQTMLPGRKCIAFAEAAGGEYTSLWCIDNNEEGNIVRITYGKCNGYEVKGV